MPADVLTRSGASWDRRGLPAWTYHSPALLELEKQELFRKHWQIAGHVSDVASPGDYFTFDIADDRVLVMRGEDGVVRGFHNLCRHRGARVAVQQSGHCARALVCPFHGWAYGTDGRLRGAARPETFGALDRSAFGLKPLETEIWQGFIFIRLLPGPQRSVAETMRRHAARFVAHRTEELVAAGPPDLSTLDVNWKSLRDVDNEGYHVAMAHPALHELYGASYRDEPFENGVSHSEGRFVREGASLWSVRHYLALSDPPQWFDKERREVWAYYGLFPNAVFALTPEHVQFYQEFPLGVERTQLRCITYRRPVETREQRAARYLAARIDRETSAEDMALSVWSNDSMKSCGFEGFHLSDLEKGVRSHHDHIRALLPVTRLDARPEEREVRTLNERMLSGRDHSPA